MYQYSVVPHAHTYLTYLHTYLHTYTKIFHPISSIYLLQKARPRVPHCRYPHQRNHKNNRTEQPQTEPKSEMQPNLAFLSVLLAATTTTASAIIPNPLTPILGWPKCNRCVPAVYEDGTAPAPATVCFGVGTTEQAPTGPCAYWYCCGEPVSLVFLGGFFGLLTSYLPTFLLAYLCICLPLYLSICLSVCLLVWLSVCLAVCLSVSLRFWVP